MAYPNRFGGDPSARGMLNSGGMRRGTRSALPRHLARATVLLGVLALAAGCGFGGGASPTAIENNAAAKVPGNTFSHTPFAATGQDLKPYLPRTLARLTTDGTYYIEAVTLKKLPNSPYVFYEDASARVISRIPYYPTLASMNQSQLAAFASGNDLTILRKLHADRATARIITDIIGIQVHTVAVSSLPKALRGGITGRHVEAVSFLNLPLGSVGARNYFPLDVSTVVMAPGSGQIIGSYSSPLPLPSDLSQ